MTQNHEKLERLLKELFQLDQPDLDFGLYRVMHARSAEVSQFLDKDLLPQVQAAFGQYRAADKAEMEKELAKAIEQAQGLGVDPETTQKVKDLRARLKSDAVDVGALESEVYDHLFSFFRRYYSEGDFLAKRVYKPGVYAIPYEGEEVTLHWANKDQYYIKTSEYLRDYAFRLQPDNDQKPMRVHFRLADAVEGEHGNVKAAEGKERRFKLTDENALVVENGELVVRFTYQPAPLKQKELNAAAEQAVLAARDPALAEWIAALGQPHVRPDGTSSGTRLWVHLDRYTARNTFDYFIHKDLGTFLRRELDFYIKNEVMHLDDVENETAPRVEQYLSKIKVIRRIAGKIIAFLSQLEDFQKKLWLKKKFVVETQWCITVGCIPEAFYAEIAANEAQCEEWVKLCAIDEIQGDLIKLGYSKELQPEFLKTHPTLVVDTRHFDAGFTARLLEAMGDVDEQTDGVLYHSENFQALSLMQARYRERVRCIYIDPPYNTEQDRVSGKFLYKDSYERSSWIALLESRLAQLRRVTADDGVLFASIDEHEVHRLVELSLSTFRDRIGLFTWVKKKKGSHLSHTIRDMTEYVVAVSPNKTSVELFGENAYSDKAQPLAKRTNKPKELFFPHDCVRTTLADGLYEAGTYGSGTSALSFTEPFSVTNGIVTTGIRVLGPFVWTQSTLDSEIASGSQVNLSKKFGFNVLRSGQEDRVKRPSTLLDKGSGIGTNEDASAELIDMFGQEGMASYPKPVSLIAYLVRACALEDGQSTLDSFAGSGTTGHAVINLNREDGGRRRFILVEMGDYFDTVLLPRIKKVTFTPEWKDGRPKRLATPEEAERSPRIVKVVRLESYEDALNNLETRRTGTQQLLLEAAEAQGADGLKEQYLLRYMLDVETRGSQSLLNVQAFTDPTAYKLKVKRPGSDESREVNVDLLETFNWLIGLTVKHIAAPQTFSAAFERDSEKRLRLKGRLKQEAPSGNDNAPYWFRTVTGTTPDLPAGKAGGRKTLIIWRKLTAKPEEDNLVLDEWFTRQGYSAKDNEFDLIYVNGGNNLENLKTPDDLWRVRLIEEDFHRLMFEVDGV
jgi:adenine-specific DNA-methyltransferase